MERPNPYAPPATANAGSAPTEDRPALWNPNAASNWSVLLSPAFGAYLHARNWEALGQPDKAATSRNWMIAYIVYSVAVGTVGIALSEAHPVFRFGRVGGILWLFVWYFDVAKPHATYVATRFGTEYPRRGWVKPLLFALGAHLAAMVGMELMAFIAEAVLGAV
jgi:hypothetical protein